MQSHEKLHYVVPSRIAKVSSVEVVIVSWSKKNKIIGMSSLTWININSTVDVDEAGEIRSNTENTKYYIYWKYHCEYFVTIFVK